MISKIKEWLFGKVILSKVIGKFVKGGIATLAGMAGVTQFLADSGVTVDWTKLESYLIAVIGGLIPAIWNFIQHRWLKKT